MDFVLRNADDRWSALGWVRLPSLGIAGGYTGRLLTESPERPLYIVARLVDYGDSYDDT